MPGEEGCALKVIGTKAVAEGFKAGIEDEVAEAESCSEGEVEPAED
jgi:hypothetical protein